jgi:hypothetical protein
MSGVLLTSTASGVAVTANAEVLPKDALPTPAVVRRVFTPAETLTSYVEVYDNSSPMAHGLEVTVAVVDAESGRGVFDARDRRDVEASNRTRTHGFRTPIPLRDVPPGRYVLRVQATAGSQAATRELLFEVR